jgi:5-oxoprolinase (ATP-hydrolysing) subunit A
VPTVDLNADVGEVSDPDDVDTALLDVVSSASVACGVHAGTPAVMAATLAAAVARRVTIGAHPSYADRAGFGRRPMTVAPDQLSRDITDQLVTLRQAAREVGAVVRFVKPHGALYNAMATDPELTRTVAAAVRGVDADLVLLVQAGTVAVEAARRAGVGVASEAFADRAYLGDGRLVPRTDAAAVIDDADSVAARAVVLAGEGRVLSRDGTWRMLRPSSICVHGDTPGAAGLAGAVRAALTAAGVEIAPFVRDTHA